MGNYNHKQTQVEIEKEERRDEFKVNIDEIKGQKDKEKEVKNKIDFLFKEAGVEIQDFTFSGKVNMLFEVKLCFFSSERKFFNITPENRKLLEKLIWKNLVSTTCKNVHGVEKLTDEEILNVCVSSCQENMSLYLNVGTRSVDEITQDL